MRNRAFDKLVVCSTAGLAPLYADMKPLFLPHTISGRRDCHRMRPGSIVNPAEARRIRREITQTVARLKREGHHVHHIESVPADRTKAVGVRRPIAKQVFVKYGEAYRVAEPYPVVIHARNRPDNVKTSGDNYPVPEWVELLKLLDKAGFSKVAAIGTKAASSAPEGAVDLRDQKLQATMDLMAAATVVLGPSSGPMHLASLCGTPHMVWATDYRQSAIGTCNNQDRYESYWRPFKTPVKVLLHKSNQVIPPQQIAEAVIELVATTGKNR
jgi:hypothetical protein